MWLRARLVMPIAAPPIADGAVEVVRGRIAAVGRWRACRKQAAGVVEDLGETVLMPGLVNAHCHLDYTHMAGGLPPPRYFPDWLKGILAWKAHWSYSEYAQSWLAGARMLVRHGVTTVADIEAVPELLPDVWTSTPLRVFSLLEMTNVRSRRPAQEILGGVSALLAALPAGRSRGGLSPHALYSTSPALLQAAARLARRKRWIMAVHVAESVDEFEMFTRSAGRLYDWLAPQRDMSDCGGRTPVERLAELGVLGPRLLAVHVNYFTPGDARLLARHRVSVAHCPRCHAYFKHRPFALPALLRAGVNVCLGTDSLASIAKNRGHLPELSLWDEMRELARAQPDLPPQTILALATCHGARALGMAGRAGQITVGAAADLIVLPCATPAAGVAEVLVHQRHQPSAVMIGGRWVHPHI